jgi:hypothetical protein
MIFASTTLRDLAGEALVPVAPQPVCALSHIWDGWPTSARLRNCRGDAKILA